jgi:hypothetical protein
VKTSVKAAVEAAQIGRKIEHPARNSVSNKDCRSRRQTYTPYWDVEGKRDRYENSCAT